MNPPRLRVGQAAEEERHATWLELFYDLVFVAAIAQLSNSLYQDVSAVGISRYVLLFIPVWWAWVGHTFYLTRFDADDLYHRLLTMAQMALVAFMASQIPKALDEKSVGFALSYVGVRSILIFEYFRAGWHIPEARPLTTRYGIGFSVAALIWVASVFVPAPLRFVFWAVGIFVDLITPFTSSSIHIRIPPHFSHIPERFGLFTIIVLGEGVVAVVSGLGHEELHRSAVFLGIGGLAVAFTVWWGYFEGVKAANRRVVSTDTERRQYQAWLFAHLPLTIAITAAAVGVHRLMVLADGAPVSTFDGWLLVCAAGTCMACLNIITLTSPNVSLSRCTMKFNLPHYVLMMLMFASGFLIPFLRPLALMGIVTGLFMGEILYSLRPIPEETPCDPPVIVGRTS